MQRVFGKWTAVAAAVALGAVLSTATGLAQGRQGGGGRQGGAAPAAAPAGGGGMDNVQIEALFVQGNVWMLTGGGFNAAASIGPDGVLIVDTMVAPLGEKLLAKIREIAP